MNDVAIARLDWDSEFFGAQIGRADPSTPAEIQQVARVAHEAQYDCVYMLLEGDDFDGRDAALRAGFRAVGQRVTFRAETLPDPPATAAELRPATADDLEQLEPIARDAFRDSRFFWDPRFSLANARELYATWLRKSVCEGYHDQVYCAEVDGEAAAFVTCDIHRREDERVGQIGLIGVGESARGRGVGTAMIHRAHRYYRDSGAAAAEVVTHGSNLAAQRLYVRHGYLPHRIQTWFHWWSE